MNTTQRITAAAATILLLAATPAGATSHEPAPPAEPGEIQWPPASTNGAFVPLPEGYSAPATIPLCDSEVTIAQEFIEPGVYRALVTEDGDTVVQYGGTMSLDITRASDGAQLQDILLDSSPIETYAADGLSATADYPGPALVIALDEIQIQALAEEGLPQAFLYLSGRFVNTVTLDSVPEPGAEPPAVVDVEIVENSTEYVFDICDLLDQAASDDSDPSQPTG